MELAAVNGMNPAKLLGNSITEQMFQEDIFDKWEVLKTSYTSSDNSKGGRPSMDETEISSTTEQTRQNDGNDPDNRM